MVFWVAARRVARRPAAKEGNSQEGSSCEHQREEQQAKSIGCNSRVVSEGAAAVGTRAMQKEMLIGASSS
jgi:hypothetical protein